MIHERYIRRRPLRVNGRRAPPHEDEIAAVMAGAADLAISGVCGAVGDDGVAQAAEQLLAVDDAVVVIERFRKACAKTEWPAPPASSTGSRPPE